MVTAYDRHDSKDQDPWIRYESHLRFHSMLLNYNPVFTEKDSCEFSEGIRFALGMISWLLRNENFAWAISALPAFGIGPSWS